MLADSGWPPPLGRWQSAQARTLVALVPFETTVGICGCSSGNQSGGPKPSPIWAAVYCFLLPGTVSIFSVSGPLPPLPFGAAGYAQSMPSTANAVTMAQATIIATAETILLIEVLPSFKLFYCGG